MVCLTYWREYRTYFHIAGDWQVSEATVCRTVHWVEDVLVNSLRFRLGGKKSLLTPSQKPKTVAMDVTETPIERPLSGQKRFFSGKQKRHTLKSQFVIKDAQLPKTEPGDILVVMGTGAYNYSMASNYNRLPRPAAVIVANGEANLILRRETYQDLVQQDCLPERLKFKL
ncbi:hypothetical protein BLD44_020360 [Mastigocladus laminosus UU774]|nr:hypothetical protein BLD44_020360 [Mastigocladus laminosus UU774]